MSEKDKRKQVIRELKQQLLNRYGLQLSDQINIEIFKIINKKTLIDSSVSL
jgi:antitoxin component of RelBE/YafQ-DinJ toxin-antitoxin module